MKIASLFQHLALICLALALFSHSGLAQEKPRLAILPFDGKTVYTEIQRACKCSPSTQMDLGNNVADKLINRLSGGDTYTVVEREILQGIMREHQMNRAGLIDEQTAAEVGKWAQAGVIITGSITPIVKYKNYLGYYNSAEVEVILEARIVSVKTATVIAPVNARSEKLSGKYRNGDGILDMVIQATDDAVGKLAAGLVEKAVSPEVKATILEGATPVAPGSKLSSCGKIASIDNKELVVKKTAEGMKVGQKLRLRRRTGVINDPDDPRKIIDYKYQEVGSISITEMRDSTSIGVFTGNSDPKIGDEVFCPVPTGGGQPPRLNSNPGAGNTQPGLQPSALKTYRFSGLFSVDIPGDWQESSNQDSVWLFPKGTKVGENYTQGVLAGIHQPKQKELGAASNEYVAGILSNNSHLKPLGAATVTNLGGRRTLARTFSGMSPQTGATEMVTIYTSLLNDGRMLYFVTFAPKNLQQSHAALQKVVGSFRAQ